MVESPVKLDKTVQKALEALQRNRPAQARQFCHRLLKKNPQDFNALQLQAMALVREGKHRAAEGYFARAAEAAPNRELNHKMRVEQARSRECLGDGDGALKLIETVLAENFTHAEALHVKGRILRYRGEERAALEAFKQLVLFPVDCVAGAEYTRAFAHWCILTSPALKPLAMDVELARKDLEWMHNPDDRALLWFGIYNGLERLEQFANAWEALKQGNGMIWQQVGYPLHLLRQEREQLLREIACNHQPQPVVANSLPLAFISGLPRSGTTLIESVLMECPGVVTRGESTEVTKSFDAVYGRKPVIAEDGIYDSVRLGQFARRLNKCLLPDPSEHARLVLEKTPGNFFAANLLLHSFARIRFINSRKTPREACFSLFRQNFENKRRLAYSYNLTACVMQYRIHEHIVQALEKHYPGQVLSIAYEELVREDDAAWRRLFDFLDLEWDPRFRDIRNSRRVVKTISTAQVREGITRRYLARTDCYGRLLRELDELLELSIDELAVRDAQPGLATG